MAKVKIQGNASGTGILTVTAPNTSTDRTITLPDSTATIATTTEVALKAPIASPEFTGNVGIGVTPESWSSNVNALQVGDKGGIWTYDDNSNPEQFVISENVYNDATGTEKYIETDKASKFYQRNGEQKFFVAASGTADSAISWTTAMIINNDGIVTKPNQPVFDVGFSTSGTASQGTIVHNNTITDIGGNHSTSNGRFTAPVAGTYYFYTTFIKANTTSVGRRYIQVNGSKVANSRHLRLDSNSSYGDNGTLAITVTLSAGDYVTAYQEDTDSYGEGYDYFGGYLIG